MPSGHEMKKRALIIGVSGQDGSYLSHLLLGKGYEIHGTSRDKECTDFSRLEQLGILEDVELHSANLTDFRSILEVLRVIEPDEVYNLSAQSSVALSFAQPVETLGSIVTATLNLLEAIRLLNKKPRLYNSSSSEMFGGAGSSAASEDIPFRPCSPYGVSKAAAHWLVESYRKSYGLYACSGILFNHESPLRHERFVTQKIVRSAVAISRGIEKRVKLGNLDVIRDWGWAPDYVDGMWRMLQLAEPIDLVLATGQACSLKEFTATAFAQVGLDWQEYVDFDSQFLRPCDVQYTVGDPTRARQILGWEAATRGSMLTRKLVAAEIARCEAVSNNAVQPVETLL